MNSQLTRAGRRRTTVVLLAIALVALGTTAVAASGGEVSSTFDNDAEGWTVEGDAQSVTPTFESTGGNPGGHIAADDTATGGVWYWNSSGAYLGDKSQFVNGTLEYDLRVSANDSQFADSDVVLEGGGTTLVYDHGDESTHPGTEWTEYEVVLNASDDGWTNQNTGADPTTSEFESVMSSLSSLEIRGEYRSGSDTGRLDNVVLSAESTVSVTASGDTVNPGGEASVNVTARNVTSVAVSNVPSSWNVSSVRKDGALFSDAVDSDGEVRWVWLTEQPTVDLYVVFELPDGAQTGDYVLDVEADGPGPNATDMATVSVTEGNIASVDGLQTTLSDTDGDGLDDQVQADVSVSNTSRTSVTFGEANFDVDVSPTDGSQGALFQTSDPDGDGTNETAQIDVLGNISTTYTFVANLSGQSDGDTGTVDVTLDEGEDTDSATYTVTEQTGGGNNPFFSGGGPLSKPDAADVLFEWNTNNGVVNGRNIPKSDMADFLFDWNLAQ